MRLRFPVLALALLAPAAVPLAVAGPASYAAAEGTGADHAHDAPVTVTTDLGTYVVDPVRSGPDVPAYDRRDASSAPLARQRSLTLNSNPGSERTIYLDFDGHRVAGTAWNSESGLAAQTYAGWSLDSDPAFSATELAFIREVWLIVAEDFAPFDVNVTTQDPGEDAITRDGRNDRFYGTRAFVTNDDEPLEVICGNGCSGIAYTGALANPDFHADLQPAWIFGQIQSSMTPKPVAETISHEVGHQLNLQHDGRFGEAYYEGHDIWAPIMGFSDFEPVTQWSDGAYSGYSTDDDFQAIDDDIATIADSGAPLRADEAGSTVQTAAATPPGSAVITSRTDVDVFALGTCTGSFTVTADPAAFAPNLDIELRVLDASGSTLATDNPPSFQQGDDLDTAGGMGASIVTTGTGQPLFARVDGIGTGNPSTAYDDFGSVGAYTLTVDGCEPDPEPETTVPGAPTIGSPVRGTKGRPLTAGIRWSPPSSDGGAPITGYVVYFARVDAFGNELKSFFSDELPTDRRSANFKVARGLYRFQVVAVNSVGESALSVPSTTVKAR
ncbi:unannotated protein [freshwater metagenome]|uniref:Unannotated protein n=1 Tax=freshwater metagenome TaxID=449393 RepID=A0A6J6V5W9_9ZZZZ|nr:hypothetical protein [Actinomycetota bacterium]